MLQWCEREALVNATQHYTRTRETLLLGRNAEQFHSITLCFMHLENGQQYTWIIYYTALLNAVERSVHLHRPFTTLQAVNYI